MSGNGWTRVVLVALGVSIAGCSDPKGAAGEDLDLPDLGLEATATTGIIRGVVVDEAIRPLGNATITLDVQPAPREVQTTPEGAFGFDGLDPGTYFLQVTKFGFASTQQSVDVVAGVSEPPAVKVLLTRIPGLVAFVEAFSWDGYMECGTNNVIACAGPNAGSQIVCGTTSGHQPPVPPTVPVCMGNFTNDEFTIWQNVTAGADHLQVEMVWESTQAVSDRLNILLRYGSRTDFDGGFYNGSLNSSGSSSSPAYTTANATELEEAEIGVNNGIVVAIFPGAFVEQDIPGVGNRGFGFTFQQRWTTFTHAFHAYMPPPGWRFTTDGSVPLPPQ